MIIQSYSTLRPAEIVGWFGEGFCLFFFEFIFPFSQSVKSVGYISHAVTSLDVIWIPINVYLGSCVLAKLAFYFYFSSVEFSFSSNHVFFLREGKGLIIQLTS